MQYWLSTRDLGLESLWVMEWDNYISFLRKVGIVLREDIGDLLVWSWKGSNGLLTTNAYIEIKSPDLSGGIHTYGNRMVL